MIRVIPGEKRKQYWREIDEMHRLRKRVFHERMKWQVPIIRHYEIDGYDALDPVYLASIAPSGKVIGSVRLLPTIGPNMLNDEFPQLLPNGERIESPLIWECSRFSADLDADSQIGPKGISRVTAELSLAMNEFGMRLGLSHMVTVYDAFMHRLLKRAGCAGEPIGPPIRIGSVLAYAVTVTIGTETENAFRDASGIAGSVLEDSDTTTDLFKHAA